MSPARKYVVLDEISSVVCVVFINVDASDRGIVLPWPCQAIDRPVPFVDRDPRFPQR